MKIKKDVCAELEKESKNKKSVGRWLKSRKAKPDLKNKNGGKKQ